jgi:hypothetical protein
MNTEREIQTIEMTLENNSYRALQEAIKYFRNSSNDQISSYAKGAKLNSSRAVLISVLTEIKNMLVKLVEEEKKVNNSHDFNIGSDQLCQALMTTQNWNEVLDKVFPEYTNYTHPKPKPIECINPQLNIEHYWTKEFTPSKPLVLVN